MLILSFLLQLFGATFLLLFAVRMVRTGIERAFGASFRRMLTTKKNPLRLVALGTALAVVLQSSAAVTLLAAGFAASGAVTFLHAVAIVLGGDLGSALLIQILSLKVDWLVPVLLDRGRRPSVPENGPTQPETGRAHHSGCRLDPDRPSVLYARQSSQFRTAECSNVAFWLVGRRSPDGLHSGRPHLRFVMHSSVAAVLDGCHGCRDECDALFCWGRDRSGGQPRLGADPRLVGARILQPAARRIILANLSACAGRCRFWFWPR